MYRRTTGSHAAIGGQRIVRPPAIEKWQRNRRPTVRVFVYGTLTNPDRVETVLEGQPPARYAFEDEAVLEGLHRVDGRYPTLAPGGRVEGRVLAVDERGLDRLDRYEGIETGLYVRVSVPDADGCGSIAVYVGDPTRLGIEPDLEWPPGESFAKRVRTAVRRTDVRVRRTE